MQTDASRSEVLSVAMFFITMILLSLAALYATGGLDGLFTSRERIHVAFNESVTGLGIGSPVSVSGVDVGRVVSIRSMTDRTARKQVQNALVIAHRPRSRNGRRAGRIRSGSEYLKHNDPLVLATVEVKAGSIPLNRKTRVSLITTNFTAAQAVRFSAAAPETADRLSSGPVVVDADLSPLSTLRNRFLKRNEGALREQNIQRINQLLKNLQTVSKQLTQIAGTENRKTIQAVLNNHRKVAGTLNRWLNGPSLCSGSQDVRVTKITENGSVRYRYECPGSDKTWTRDHPPEPGRLQETVRKLDQLLVRLNTLVSPSANDDKNIPSLVKKVHRLSGKMERTLNTVQAFVRENRSRIGRLLKDVNRLSNDLSDLATQLNRNPSSAVYGRRGPEIQRPYDQ